VIISGFVTHKDIEIAKEQARLEHDAIYEKIADTEQDVLATQEDATGYRIPSRQYSVQFLRYYLLMCY
jgi:hypothetical protein